MVKTTLLPLHSGKAPFWLIQRMAKLGRSICEAIVLFYGRDELLRRLSDPLWFQAMGCVLGFDWHSSGVTTTLCGALKTGLLPVMDELGIFICGGKGKSSLKTPDEIRRFGEKTGINVENLIKTSKLVAKIDSSCIQDGFDLYHHTFIFTQDGKWCVIQQGMNPEIKKARRYHWFSEDVKDMVNEPHTAVCCDVKVKAMNLVAEESRGARSAFLRMARESPHLIMKEILVMPDEHHIKNKKLIEASLWKLYENAPENFEDILLIRGMGKESIRALALVSEIIFGEKVAYKDPVRYSFAHGGKDGHPYPLRRDIYDRTISFMEEILSRAKLNPVERDRSYSYLKKLGTLWRR